MVAELVIHIGDVKTGTTAIQTVLARELVESPGTDIFFASVANNIPLSQALYMPEKAGRVQGEFIRLRRLLNASTAAVGVVSSEEFEFTDPAVLDEALRTYLPGYRNRLRVIGYVRPHAARILSSCSEAIKNGAPLVSVRNVHDRFAGNGQLLYAPRLRRWQAVFGAAFEVRPFVRGRLRDGDVVADFLEFVLRGAPYSLRDVPRANESLCLEDLVVLRELHRAMGLDGPENRGLRMALGWNLAPFLAQYRQDPGTRLRLDRALVRQIQDHYAQDATETDAAFFTGTPLSDALAGAADAALPEPQSLHPEDHLAPEAIAQIHAFGALLARMATTNPDGFRQMVRDPAIAERRKRLEAMLPGGGLRAGVKAALGRD